MYDNLILITGAAGHLGFRVLVRALEAGYHVRATVRKSQYINAIKATKSVQPYLTNLEFAIEDDFAADGAYDVAMKDVVGVVHCANPVQYQNWHSVFTPTVKRVVITSAINAIVAWDELLFKPASRIVRDHQTIPKPTPPFINCYETYSASEVYARHATDDFVAVRRPDFDVINIMPSFMIGKDELITDFKEIELGTNFFALTAIRGYKNQPAPGITVHVDDAARVHVRALDNNVLRRVDDPIYDHFLVSSGGLMGTTFDDAIDIVKTAFKAKSQQGLFPFGGTQPSKIGCVDSSRTEKVFGLDLKNFEEQVVSVAEHYIDLAHAACITSSEDVAGTLDCPHAA